MLRNLLLAFLTLCALTAHAQLDQVRWARTTGICNHGYFYKQFSHDSGGNMYGAGFFSDTIVFGSTTLISRTSRDAFIVKLSPEGQVIWAQQASALRSETTTRGMAISPGGDVYLNIQMYDTLLLGSINVVNTTRYGTSAIAKLSRDGIWQWGKVCNMYVNGGMVIDSAENLLVAGRIGTGSNIEGTSFTPAVSQFGLGLAKITPTGSVLWARSFATSASYSLGVPDMKATQRGGLVLSANFYGGSMRIGSTTLEPDSIMTGVLVKCNPDASIAWLLPMEGGSYTAFNYLAVDRDTVYSSFNYQGRVRLGPFSLDSAYFTAGIAKISPDGTALWAHPIIGADAYAGNVGLASQGGIFLEGYKQRGIADFGNGYSINSPYNQEFVARFDRNALAKDLVYFGGNSQDMMDVGTDGAVFISNNVSGQVQVGSTTISSPGSSYHLYVIKIQATPVASKSRYSISWDLSPNPARDIVRIQGHPGTIKVLDVWGKVRLQAEAQEDVTRVNVNTLPRGLYMIVAGDKRQRLVLE